jgi:hypothetical protein
MNSETRLNSMDSYQHYVIGHNVTKTASGFNLDSTYFKKYYSMIDAEIYFGDNYIEDAHDVMWSVTQNTQPLFGFNSYIFDEVAQGNRIIQGGFVINFTGASTLDKLIDAAKKATVFPSSYAVTNVTVTPNNTEDNKDAPQKDATATKAATAHTNTGSVKANPDRAPIWRPLFDIDVVCMGDSRGGRPAHIVLQDVVITTIGAKIAAEGGVFQQQCSFLARDIKMID